MEVQTHPDLPAIQGWLRANKDFSVVWMQEQSCVWQVCRLNSGLQLQHLPGPALEYRGPDLSDS